MIRLYMDECVHGAITRGLLRKRVDALTVQEDGHSQATDSDVIRRATNLRRVVFTNDPDLLEVAHALQASDIRFSGIIYSVQRTPIGICISDLELIAACTELDEWFDRLGYIPLP